ncbi:MAG: Tetracycline resistance protein, class B [Alphaproteobacteria bacterium MarineAlpha11_Bin1]|nr:MAG: Tetracycline resistance protein, class B [Alphaproteobacteria bacterium MarineAlpha11_Bin1]
MYALILIVFVDTVGFGIVLPLLPLYAQKFGASPEMVTLVAVSFTFGQAVFGPFWGWISDRLGRKPVLLLTITGTLCAYILLAFSSSLVILFIVRFLAGAMAANMSVAHALVADITRAEDRTRNIARLSGAAGLGFVAGPAIGGLLAGVDAGGSVFLLPYLAAAVFSAIALILTLILIRESVTSDRKERARVSYGLDTWRSALAHGQTRLILFLSLLPPFVFAGIEVIIVLWSERAWGWGPLQNGYFYAWMGACHVVIQWVLIGPLARWMGEKILITFGAFSLGMGVLLMPLAGDQILLYFAAFLMIFGTSSCASPLSSLLSQYADPASRGSVLGLGQAFAGSGRIVGPALAGFVFASVGIDWPFYFGAATMVIMALGSRFILVKRASDIASEDP